MLLPTPRTPRRKKPCPGGRRSFLAPCRHTSMNIDGMVSVFRGSAHDVVRACMIEKAAGFRQEVHAIAVPALAVRRALDRSKPWPGSRASSLSGPGTGMPTAYDRGCAHLRRCRATRRSSSMSQSLSSECCHTHRRRRLSPAMLRCGRSPAPGFEDSRAGTTRNHGEEMSDVRHAICLCAQGRDPAWKPAAC